MNNIWHLFTFPFFCKIWPTHTRILSNILSIHQTSLAPKNCFSVLQKYTLNFTTSLSTVPLISWKVNWATGLYWELNFETLAIWGSSPNWLCLPHHHSICTACVSSCFNPTFSEVYIWNKWLMSEWHLSIS